MKDLPKKILSQEAKYREFAGQYIIDFKPKEAYERCDCYTATGRTAQSSALKLLARDDVQQYIREEQEARKKRLQIDQDAVVTEWARIGFADIRNYVAWNSDAVMFRDSEQLSDDEARAVQEVWVDEQDMGAAGVKRKMKFKLHSKQPALDALAKHLGLYKPLEHKVEHFGTILAPATADPSDWQRIVGHHTGETVDHD